MTIFGYWDFLGADGFRIVCEAGAAAYVWMSVTSMATGKSRINSVVVLEMFMAPPDGYFNAAHNTTQNKPPSMQLLE